MLVRRTLNGMHRIEDLDSEFVTVSALVESNGSIEWQHRLFASTVRLEWWRRKITMIPSKNRMVASNGGMAASNSSIG